MTGKTLRIALLTSLALVCVTLTAMADSADEAKEPVKEPIKAPTPVAAPAATQKVLVTICVPEQYETTRNVCKLEWKEEKYTAIKCELVPEEHTRKVTYCTSIPVTKDVEVVRIVCEPVIVEKPCTRYITRCVPVEKTVSKVVDVGGHYECKEVPCPERHRLFHRHCGCEDECVPPPMKLVSVYVPKCEIVTTKVMVMERTCQPVTEMVKVTTYKPKEVKEMIKVTTCEIKTEVKEEKCTVMVEKRTPYEATRKVAYQVMVPEKYMATRMVTKQVEREVPCAAPCAPCESSCCDSCTHSSGRHQRGGLFHRGCR